MYIKKKQIPSVIRKIFILAGIWLFASGFKPGHPGTNGSGEPDKTQLKKLSAILMVGPQQDGTEDAIGAMEKIADFFTEKGIQVYRFYDDDTNWEEIKNAAKNASFLVYSGHGTNLGENGAVGGFVLHSNYSSRDIKQELKLKKNAVIIFKSVCYGAGSSAGDDIDIGIREAERRVSDYALPFFSTGAACYYANNIGHGCLDFLTHFFAGETLQACFEATANFNTIEGSNPYTHDSNKVISIASSEWSGTAIRTTYTNGVKTVEEIPSVKDYDIAFIGRPDFSIEDVLNGI